MTTGGEGGMVTTNDENLMEKKCGHIKTTVKTLIAFITNSIRRVSVGCMTASGTNWRMMEMQAVIGRLQLETNARMDSET